MNDFTKFKEWPKQELFGGLMLQYDLTTSEKKIINIPFQIIEWCTCSAHSEMWNEENTETEILLEGHIIFEGVRHCNFAPKYDGYMNYPSLFELSEAIKRVHELCLQYSRDYL